MAIYRRLTAQSSYSFKLLRTMLDDSPRHLRTRSGSFSGPGSPRAAEPRAIPPQDPGSTPARPVNENERSINKREINKYMHTHPRTLSTKTRDQ